MTPNPNTSPMKANIQLNFNMPSLVVSWKASQLGISLKEDALKVNTTAILEIILTNLHNAKLYFFFFSIEVFKISSRFLLPLKIHSYSLQNYFKRSLNKKLPSSACPSPFRGERTLMQVQNLSLVKQKSISSLPLLPLLNIWPFPHAVSDIYPGLPWTTLNLLNQREIYLFIHLFKEGNQLRVHIKKFISEVDYWFIHLINFKKIFLVTWLFLL